MSKQINQLYQSFLIRCWSIPPKTIDEPAAWRFELREVSADYQEHRFSDLEQLNEWMSEKLASIAVDRKRAGGKEEE